MSAVRRFGSGDWGSVRVANLDLPMRAIVTVISVAAWLTVTVLLTSLEDTLNAAVANVSFVVGLVLLASLTRTIDVFTVLRAFLLGAVAMAIVLLLAGPLGGLASDPRSTVDPIAEEVVKLIPLGLLLWQARRFSVWQLGATDFLLIAVAAGAGFALVEDSYIRMNQGWGETVPLLPTTEIYDDRIRGVHRVIAGHAVWTGLAGVTIGIAWLWAHIRPALLLAPLGFVVVTIDHMSSNSGHRLPELGLLVVALFVVGLLAVLALDLYVLRRAIPAVPDLDAALARPGSLLSRWDRWLESRRLRFAAWRFARRSARSGAAQLALERSVIQLVDGPAS